MSNDPVRQSFGLRRRTLAILLVIGMVAMVTSPMIALGSGISQEQLGEELPDTPELKSSPPGPEPLAFNPLFSDDMESGPNGWTVEDMWSGSIWELGTPTSGPGSTPSGINCWGTNLTGNYDDETDTVLVSPPIDITGYQNVYLSFQMWFESKNWFDTGYVEASTDNSSWDVITPITGPEYYRTIMGAWDGYTDLLGGWHQPEFDLAPFSGGNVWVRFHFLGASVTSLAGWYIDDVAVGYYDHRMEMTPDFQMKSGFQSTDVTHVLTVNNTGVNDDTYDLIYIDNNLPWVVTFRDISDTATITNISVQSSATKNIIAKVSIPIGASAGEYSDVNITAESQNDTGVSRTARIISQFPYNVDWFDDFDPQTNPWSNITFKQGVQPTYWQIGDPSGFGPGTGYGGSTNCAGTNVQGNYYHNADMAFMTPLVYLSGPGPYVLSFQNWYFMSEGFDEGGGFVELSVDGGSWGQIYPEEGYPSSGSMGGYNTEGYSDISSGWEYEEFELTWFAGHVVQVRFHFAVSPWCNEPGWYIDDLYIGTSPSYRCELTPGWQENFGHPGEYVDHILHIRNKGSSADTYDLSNASNNWPITFRDINDTMDITNVSVPVLGTVDFIARVSIPGGVVPPSGDVADINITSQNDTAIDGTAQISTQAPIEPPWFNDIEGNGWMDFWIWDSGDGTFWDWGASPYGTYGPAAAHSPAICWGANIDSNYTTCGEARLTIPFIDLANVSLTSANLTFWHWYDIDGGATNGDGGWVEISADQGSTWDKIYPEGGYPDSCSWLDAYTGTSAGWEKAEFNLTDYLGNIVLIRFYIRDFWDGTQRAGWYIDDVSLDATFMDYGVILTPEEDRQIAPDGNSVFYRMTATNIGVAGPDRFMLSTNSIEGWPTRIYDVNMSCQLSIVGPLAYGESEDFWVEVQIPEGAGMTPFTNETTWVKAVSVYDPVVYQKKANDTAVLYTECLEPILVVDDDNGIGSEDLFTNALDANGYKYNYWPLNTSGSPSLDILNRYKAVIWFTGNTMGDVPAGPTMQAETLSAADRANIQSYLEGGGKVYLSGSLLEFDAYNAGNWGAWFEEWFSTQATDQHPAGTPSSGVGDFPTTPQTILGQPGDPIGNGLTLDPHEGDYWPEIMGYYWINQPVGDGMTCFNYTPGLADGTDGAMIRAENGTYGFRTVFSAFDFSEVNNNPTNRTDLMDRIMNWLLFGENPNATAFSPISSATNNATPTIRYVHGNTPASVDIYYWDGSWHLWGNDVTVDGTWIPGSALPASGDYYWCACANGVELAPTLFIDAEAGPYTLDLDAPTIILTNPTDVASNEGTTAGTYVIQFNESMDRTGIPLTNLPILKWSWDSTGMWLNGTYSTLADLTTYYVNLTGQGFYDLAGNDLIGDTDKNFTTGDYTAPTITSTAPADGATGVSNASGTYIIQFSEPMAASGTPVSNLPGVSWSWQSPSEMRGTYDNLTSSTAYYVNLTDPSFHDASLNNNPLVGDVDKNFTTGDFIPPTVVGTTPANGATNITTAAGNYTIHFSEPMDNTTGFVVSDLPSVTWTWSPDGRWFNASYNELEGGKRYGFLLGPMGNEFKDLAGNPLPEAGKNKNFTTGKPWATATGPISTGTNNNTPTITYDFGNNATEVGIYTTNDGGITWKNWDYDDTVDGIWVPTGAVGPTGTYQWSARACGSVLGADEPVPSGAASIECGDYVLDMDGPRVNSTIPANWDYDINRAAGTYVIEFDEEMDTSHGTVLSTLPGISWSWDSTGMWLNGTYTVLAAETIYYVNLTDQGFVDLVGNALTGQTDMEFKTERSPWAVAGGQTSEGTDNPRPWISYSATGTTGVEIYYTSDGGTTWTLWGTDDNSNGSWIPSTDLPASGTYNWNARALGYVNEPVPNGAASIESGDYVLLSTADTAYITSTTPADGATSVGLNAGTYVIQFNKVMDNVGSPLSDLPGVTWTWSSNGMWLNGTYSALSASTSYYVNLTGQGFQSTSGYLLIGDMYRIFTTRAADETATGTVIGQVTDENGNPIAGATVTIPGTDITATTNETGWYVLEDVPEGDHTLEISHPDYDTQEVDVSVTEGETETAGTEQLPPPSAGGAMDWTMIIIILIIVVAVVIVGVLFMLKGKEPKPSFESDSAEEAAEPEQPVSQTEQPPARTPEAPPPPPED